MARLELRIGDELLESVRTKLLAGSKSVRTTPSVSQLVRTLLEDWLKQGNARPLISTLSNHTAQQLVSVTRCKCGGIKHPKTGRCVRCNQKVA